MNLLNLDMMREVAYFMNMRSLAAMSIVNRAWNAVLSDRRARIRIRVRNLVGASPAYTGESMENWYHLTEIGREVRLIRACLGNGRCYAGCLFMQRCAVWEALWALDNAFHQFCVDMDTWARALYPRAPEYEHLWPQDLMHLSPRYEYSPKESTDFSKLFAGFARLPQGRAKKRRRRAFFTSEEQAAFAQFVAYFRESMELWEKYFATYAPAFVSIRVSRGKLPAAIEVLERAIDNGGGAPY